MGSVPAWRRHNSSRERRRDRHPAHRHAPSGLCDPGQNVQGGSLDIYDATIDALEYNPNDPTNPGQINGLVGDFVDVKTVDF